MHSSQLRKRPKLWALIEASWEKYINKKKYIINIKFSLK
jgi:hypothetical protein